MMHLDNIVLSRGGRPVVKGLSAKAEKGDVIALLGPNGAGKTTLLHFIAGVLKAESGDIYFQGEKIEPKSLDWRRRLSYILDDGGTIPLLTIEEQISLQCALVGVSSLEAIERTELVIDLLELGGYREYRADELSSGLRKRLGIGIGIVRDADLFLFDEPFSALDVQAMAVFNRVVMTLKNRGRIVIIASHSFPFQDNLCNRVWALAEGKVVDHDKESELLGLISRPFQPEPPGSEEADIPWIRESR